MSHMKWDLSEEALETSFFCWTSSIIYGVARIRVPLSAPDLTMVEFFGNVHDGFGFLSLIPRKQEWSPITRARLFDHRYRRSWLNCMLCFVGFCGDASLSKLPNQVLVNAPKPRSLVRGPCPSRYREVKSWGCRDATFRGPRTAP